MLRFEYTPTNRLRSPHRVVLFTRVFGHCTDRRCAGIWRHRRHVRRNSPNIVLHICGLVRGFVALEVDPKGLISFLVSLPAKFGREPLELS